MEAIKLETAPRDVIGKKVKVLRKEGLTPIHVYGKKMDSKLLQADTKTLQRVIQRVGKNIPVTIVEGNGKGEGKGNISFVREVQEHPVSGQLLHVDFYQVDVSERIKAEVPVILVGEAPAVRIDHGVLMQALHTLQVESLPMDVPEGFQVDISFLDDFEKAIRVGDIPVSGDVTILADAEDVIARVNPPRVEEEVAEVAAEEGAEVEAIAEKKETEVGEEETKDKEE